MGAGDGGPCAQIVVGQLGVGAPCTFGFDCQPGLYCHPSSPATCGGACATPVADGLSCGPLDHCVAGDSCSGGTCGPSSSAGNGDGGVGAACSGNADCLPCLTCTFGASGGSCTAPGLVGATCSSDGQCATPLLYCNQGTCQPSGVNGDACQPLSDSACLFGWCSPSGPDAGSCADQSPLGGPCLDDHSCNGGYCTGADALKLQLGRCAALPSANQPCVEYGSCGSGLYCNQDAGLCAPLQGTGAPCTSGLECQSYSCLNGQCASPCTSGCTGSCTDGPGASLVLGLGGAMILQRRRRRRRR